MRIGADDRIGIGFDSAAKRHGAHYAREIFQIHLVADSGIRWDDFEIFEGGLAPAEKSVTLDIALKFEFGVETEGVGVAELVDLNGMIDD